jgi:hypothetical protein
VKNVTRTVTEASTTVKGLTGIDIPDLLNQALGGSDDGPKGGDSGGGGSSGGSGPSGGGGGGGASRPRPPTTSPAPASASTGAAQASSSTRPPRTSSSAAGVGAATQTAASASGEVAPPRFETPEAIDAALADADRAIRAASTTAGSAATAATPRTDTAAGPARPAVSGRPQSADITRETTVDEAAQRLAADLLAVPGIERFAGVQLETLDRAGPRPLRTMWRVARDQLGDRVGSMTIGEVIDRYGDATRGG